MTPPVYSSGTSTCTSLIGSRSTGLASLHAVAEGVDRGDLERHFRGVDVVVAAEVEAHLDIHHRVAGDHPFRQRLEDPLLHRGDELGGDHPAHDLVEELDSPAPRGSGSTLMETSANCPRPPVCFLCR